MFTTLIVTSLVYFIGFPLGFILVGVADKQYKNWRLNKQLMKRGANKTQLTRNAPEPLMPKWRGRLKYARSDKRTIVIPAKLDKNGKPVELKDGTTSQPKPTKFSRRGMYWFIRGIGFALAVLGGLIGIVAGWGVALTLLALSLVPYIWSLVWGYQSADKILTIREKLVKKMFSTARTKLGQSAEYESNPSEVVRVLEWEDEIKPQKVEFDIPDSFGEEGMENFMKHFNQNFGRETAWVPSDNPETGEPGWDFEKGILTINAVPPLPTMAPWSEHYVLGEGVAWSFFPIGLGVENGLELPNPKTGEVENVLGFDLSGEQAGVAKQFGLKMSGAITTSPMVLVAGSTGGGKALSSDTKIRVFNPDEIPASKITPL